MPKRNLVDEVALDVSGEIRGFQSPSANPVPAGFERLEARDAERRFAAMAPEQRLEYLKANPQEGKRLIARIAQRQERGRPRGFGG